MKIRYFNYVSTIVPQLYFGDVAFQVRSWLDKEPRKENDTIPILANCGDTVRKAFNNAGYRAYVTRHYDRPGHFVARLGAKY